MPVAKDRSPSLSLSFNIETTSSSAFITVSISWYFPQMLFCSEGTKSLISNPLSSEAKVWFGLSGVIALSVIGVLVAISYHAGPHKTLAAYIHLTLCLRIFGVILYWKLVRNYHICFVHWPTWYTDVYMGNHHFLSYTSIRQPSCLVNNLKFGHLKG